MKKLRKVNFRFVKTISNDGKYLSYQMQRKTRFGWKYYGYWQGGPYGSIWNIYSKPSKKEVFKEVLQYYYQTTKEFLNITEYPMIKKY